MKSKLIGGVGTAVVVVGIIAFKFFSPSAEVELMNASGSGWDDAMADFEAELAEMMNTEYDVFDLSQGDKNKFATCVAKKSIKFLNGTDCSYLYNPATTSEAEHLANQEKCLEEVKFENHQGGFILECLKEKMPTSWAVMKKIFIGVYEEAYTSQGVSSTEAKKIAECIATKLTALCDARKYKLIDEKAQDIEGLLIGVDTYIPDFEKDEEVSAIMNGCAPQDEAK